VSRLSTQCGILNISRPYRPPRPITGIALCFLLCGSETWEQSSVVSQHCAICTGLLRACALDSENIQICVKWRNEDTVIKFVSLLTFLCEFTAELYSRDILTRIKHLTLSHSFLEKANRITGIIFVFHSLFTTFVCTHISKIKTIIVYLTILATPRYNRLVTLCTKGFPWYTALV
jgi:hypothetical protein